MGGERHTLRPLKHSFSTTGLHTNVQSNRNVKKRTSAAEYQPSGRGLALARSIRREATRGVIKAPKFSLVPNLPVTSWSTLVLRQNYSESNSLSLPVRSDARRIGMFSKRKRKIEGNVLSYPTAVSRASRPHRSNPRAVTVQKYRLRRVSMRLNYYHISAKACATLQDPGA
jgi:hypothetical protein